MSGVFWPRTALTRDLPESILIDCANAESQLNMTILENSSKTNVRKKKASMYNDLQYLKETDVGLYQK